MTKPFFFSASQPQEKDKAQMMQNNSPDLGFYSRGSQVPKYCMYAPNQITVLKVGMVLQTNHIVRFLGKMLDIPVKTMFYIDVVILVIFQF